MGNGKFPYAALIIVGGLSILAPSCYNRPAEIPFPLSDSGYPQPIIKPLHFGAAKKLNWVTVRSGGIKPAIKKLDIDALPASPFDSSDFRPFARPPEVVRFNWDSLPQRAFSLDSLPSKPIKFTTSALPTPVQTKAQAPRERTGIGLPLLDIGLAQGIQGKVIWGLLKDKAGFLWIGTELGLFRFDGEYTQAYISGDTFRNISGMTQDDKGRLWYINRTGVGRIDPAHGTVDYSTAIASLFVSKMLQDDRGRIWVSYSGKGLAIIDPGRETMKSLDTLTGLAVLYPFGLHEDDEKNIWIGGDRGLSIINVEKGRIRYLRAAGGPGRNSGRAITGDKMGRVWVGFYDQGPVAVDIRHGTITRYSAPQVKPYWSTLDELVDDQGRLWVGTAANGIIIVDPVRGLIKNIRKEDGLASLMVPALLADKHHGIWAGTFLGLQAFGDDGNLVYPIGKISVQSLYEDRRGRIWVGTADGIQILDRAKKEARYLNRQLGTGNHSIQNFYEVDGDIWVTNYDGFDILDPLHKTMKHLGRKEGLSSDSLVNAIRDDRGNIWFTESTEGLEKLDSAKNRIEHAIFPESLTDHFIVDIKTDYRGMLWLATYTGGVYMIDPEKGTIQLLNQEAGLKDSCYRILFPDEYGRMWIGTDKGIYVADTRKGTLTHLSSREGLSNDYITSFIPYKNWVVAGTNDKINLITPPSAGSSAWKIGLLAGSEGLNKENQTQEADIITREGQYMWSDYGIVIINGIEEKKDVEATHIAGLNIFNRPQYFVTKPGHSGKDSLRSFFQWDSVVGSYNLPANLRIPRDQNYLQFQFARGGLVKTDTTWYCYILQGIDKRWSSFTTNTVSENYLNLPPGKYNFQVCSKQSNGLWGKPDSFLFEIMPPWWETWWAYTLYCLLFGTVLWTFSIFRSRSLTRQNKLLEEKVNLRTNALNQSLNELQSAQAQLIQSEKMASLGELTAGIAHEIQNPLNFVNNFSEVNTELIDEIDRAMEEGKMEDALDISKDLRQNLEKIAHHGKRADAIVKGMLQHSRASTGQKEPTDINALADEYLRLSYHGLRAKDKSLHADTKTDFDGGIGKIAVIPQDIGRVLLNLFNNAFYAVAEKEKLRLSGYEPTVSVSTKKTGDMVEIRVKDNGEGIPQKVLDKIFQPFFTTKPTGQGTGLGLSMSYNIIRAHGGEIKVETGEGEFTEFIIKLPGA